MKMYRANNTLVHRQKGATLLVALVVLTIATLIAIYAMKSTTFQLKMVANERLVTANFWCSKSVLDNQYEENYKKTNDMESIFQQALSQINEYVSQAVNLNWNASLPGSTASGITPTQQFSIAHTRNASSLPIGNDQDNKPFGFEFYSECLIPNATVSTQVYGLTAFGMQRPGSLVE